MEDTNMLERVLVAAEVAVVLLDHLLPLGDPFSLVLPVQQVAHPYTLSDTEWCANATPKALPLLPLTRLTG